MSATQSQPSTTATFEPRIVAFVCKWCTYAGADLAGTSRMAYPPNVRTLMLPCTGRIDISFVLRAFLQGADGVLVSGCHPGDCHYTAGNFRARRRWTIFRDLLDTLGFDLRRLDMAWISAAEGAKWVRTVQSFTDRIRELGPYSSMKQLASNRMPPIAPRPTRVSFANAASKPDKTVAAPADPALVSAVGDALTAGRVKAVIGWVANTTLKVPRPAWITSPQAAGQLVNPAESGNLARLFKNPAIRSIAPIGIVARSTELFALNVLRQEANLDPAQVRVFAVSDDGRFMGEMDCDKAADALLAPILKDMPEGRPVGFREDVIRQLDELMQKPPAERWQFWTDQFSNCIKCYACRGSCPMCSCEQCFMDKNQPQWFPTAADGPGNFAWHIMRAFHLAGRCIGCGSCQDACPANIPLNLLGAAIARSTRAHFGHRAGADPNAIPLQSDYKADDREDFIL